MVFSPTDIPSLNNWYDGSDPNGTGTAPANGASITSWKDKTTNANHMVAQTAATYASNSQNGLGTITFNNSWYRTTTANAPYPFDAYVVVKLNNTTDRVDVLGAGSKTTDSFNSLTFSEHTPNRWHNGSSNFFRTPNAVATSNETSTSFLLMSWSIANNNFYIYRNGVQIVSTTSYTWPVPSDNEFRIGSRQYFSSGNLMQGNIAEVLFFNTQLSDTDRIRVQNYLAVKWAIFTPFSGATLTSNLIQSTSGIYYGSNTNFGGSTGTDNSGNFYTVSINVTNTWKNTATILAAGGGASVTNQNSGSIQVYPGGSAIYNPSGYNVITFINYGFLLGGGGGGLSDHNGGGTGGYGGAGGGGGGGGWGAFNGGAGGSLVTSINGVNGAGSYDNGGGGGGGGPGGGFGGSRGGSGTAVGGVGGIYSNGFYQGGTQSAVVNNGSQSGGGYGGGNGLSGSGAPSGGGGGGGRGRTDVTAYATGANDGGYSIYNLGTITNLYNLQGGNNVYGPLFYAGTLPTKYYIRLDSQDNYGQLFCTGWAWSATVPVGFGNTMDIQIDPESTYKTVGTDIIFPVVFSGFNFTNISIKTTTIGLYNYSWSLVLNTTYKYNLKVTITSNIGSSAGIAISSSPYSNSTNYYGNNTNDSTVSTNYGNFYRITATIDSFINNAIILAAGGGTVSSTSLAYAGGSAFYNASYTVTTLKNYGYLLGGGGGGVPNTSGGPAGNGGAGGGGGGGGWSGSASGGVGGSLVTSTATGGASGGNSGGGGGGPGGQGGSGSLNLGGNGGFYVNGIYKGSNALFWGAYSTGGGGYGGGSIAVNQTTGAPGGGGGGGGSGLAYYGNHGGYSIYNLGAITNLYNLQGGNNIYGPLFYAGNLPTKYYINLNSQSNYGQLYCTGWYWSSLFADGTNMTIDIDPLSNYTTIGTTTFPVVFSGIIFNTLPKGTATINGLSYNWNLSLNGTNIYNLNVTIETINTNYGSNVAMKTGLEWTSYYNSTSIATGGTTTFTTGNPGNPAYTYHIFKTPGTSTITFNSATTAEYLIIGAGGAGGNNHGGGGGAGEVIYGSTAVTNTTYQVTVGTGGTPGTIKLNADNTLYITDTPGTVAGDSSIFSITAKGGGRGGGQINGDASPGGSGGGGTGYIFPTASGKVKTGGASTKTTGLGNAGGNGYSPSNDTHIGGGGGGGGSDVSGNTAVGNDGAIGGSGKSVYSVWISNIRSTMPIDWQTTTTTGVIASGGSGGSWGTASVKGPDGGAGSGGNLNGGIAAIATNAINYTGSGGGGGSSGNGYGGNGGHGLVVIRYQNMYQNDPIMSTLYSRTIRYLNNTPNTITSNVINTLQIDNANTIYTPTIQTFTTSPHVTGNVTVKLSGFFTPNQTGNWVFSMGSSVSDDLGMVFLGQAGSTSITPNFTFSSLSTTTNNTTPILYTFLTQTGTITYNTPNISLTAGAYYPLLIYYSQYNGDYRIKFSFSYNGGSAITDFTNYIVTPYLSSPIITSITPGNNQITINFTAPSNNGGSVIDFYEYSIDGDTYISTESTNTSYIIQNLTNLTQYTVYLRAHNSNGSSLPVTATATPVNPTAAYTGLGWTSYLSTFDATPYSGSASNMYGNLITYLNTNPSKITKGNTIVLQTSISPPSAPTFSVASSGNNTATLTFSAPTNTGGAAITNYKYSIDGGAFIAINQITSPYNITSGLTNGTTYAIRMKAVNSIKDGTETSPQSILIPLFSPDITGLILWLDANISSSITVTSGNVSQWADQKNNHNLTGNGTITYNATGLNSKPIVTFPGDVNSYLYKLQTNLGISSTTKYFYYFAVLQFSLHGTGNNRYNSLFGIVDRSTPYVNNLIFYLDDESTYYPFTILNTVGDFNTSAITISTSTNNNIVCLMLEVNAGNTNLIQTVRYNGTASTTRTVNLFPLASSMNITNTRFNLGDSTYPTNTFKGSMSEILMYTPSTALTSTQIQKIEGYLAYKWGIQTNLQVGHPYKSTPP